MKLKASQIGLSSRLH